MKAVWREILIAFIIGGLVGFFAASRLHHAREHERKNGQMLERFSRKLDLSADQKEQVGKILEARRENFAALREEMKPKFEEMRASLKTDLAKVLTPEQQEKFKTLDAQWEARRKEMRSRWVD